MKNITKLRKQKYKDGKELNMSKEKGSIVALLPIGVFLALFIGSGIITGDFYSMPAEIGFLIALAVAFIQNRKVGFNEKLSIVAKGAGDENIMIMALIFILAGAFSGAVSAAGGVESTVNFGLSILPSNIAIVGLYIIACFISISMGTSVGTIAALVPIAVGIHEKTNFPMALCVGAVVCGAMFGDNLSMISDTTIAAVRTQGCKMKDKFKENFLIVLPAAILTAVIFFVITKDASFQIQGDLPYNFMQIVPYLVVLIGALIGINVVLLLIGGTLVSVVVGIATASFAPMETFSVLGNGVAGMREITVISIIVGGILGLIKNNGGISYILGVIRTKIKGKRGAEFGIAALASTIDMCTANNTVAIVIAGPIAKEISDEFGVSPKRTASILDIFASVVQGIIPYGAQLLTAAQIAGITPFEIIPNLYYPFLMTISAILFIAFRKR